MLGPLLHEFGWSDTDYDLLSAGTLAGHIVECGPQCTGGNFTDWETVPGWEDMGFPIAECLADGSAIISKPEGSGGLVTPATISEQILYEIGDPGAYVMPDVVCDWRDVTLEQVGPDRVRASGARGSEPPATYKVTATHSDGYRVMTTAMFAGIDAAGKARRAGEALVARAERLIAKAGYGPITERSIEVIGAGDTHGPDHRDDAATEAVVKVGVRHPEKAALEIFALEYAPMALVAQGMTGFFADGRAWRRRSASITCWSRSPSVEVTVRIDDDVTPSTSRPATPASRSARRRSRTATRAPRRRLYGPAAAPRLRRSGDKGNNANIGVIARRRSSPP